ncbi:MAG: trypsin-like peptidase domain-containing protein [Clostridia bacterium]|nr:trypsin-like peptidase domain-containing protein [Clostridia bacterium]
MTKFKKHFLGYVAVALVAMMIGSAVTLTGAPQAQAETAQTVVHTSPFTAAVAQVRDSVVGVVNYQTVRYSNRYGSGWEDYFGFGFGFGNPYGRGYDEQPQQEQEVQAATGSGVVIAEGGVVLTNFHVVENATRLTITVGEDELDAVLLAYDENLDIAILRASELTLKPVPLGDSDTLMVGDWAICIGNPLGEQFSGTVTAGIVSALDRAVSSSSVDKYGRKETITNTMIQTDAAINSGNSGGGMFSVTGELMGIPTLKYTGSAYSGATVKGIGMCIPINAAKPLIEDVLSGKVQQTASEKSAPSNNDVTLMGKPRMGVTISGMNPNSYAVSQGLLPNGVYIVEVEEGGPAEAAGMLAGDIIVDVDDNIITSTTQLQNIISARKAGDTLNVKVYRVPGITELEGNAEIPDGEYVDLKIVLAVMEEIKQ